MNKNELKAEKLRKRTFQILIIKSVFMGIMSIMLFASALYVKITQEDQIGSFIFLIVLGFVMLLTMIGNIIYEYFKFLKKD